MILLYNQKKLSFINLCKTIKIIIICLFKSLFNCTPIFKW